MAPLPENRFGPGEAAHLLRRAGFGAPGAEVQRFRWMGVADAVDSLLNDVAPEGLLRVPALRGPADGQAVANGRAASAGAAAVGVEAVDAAPSAARRRRGDVTVEGVARWWLGRMIRSQRPLEEKLLLLWHSHFATAARDVKNPALMHDQHLRFRRQVCGSFASMVRGLLDDPAMLIYLNADRNQGSKPNENFARELMELFTLGLGHFTEQDVQEGARALTGYEVLVDRAQRHEAHHDFGTKTILGRRGEFDGPDLIEILLEHDACPPFVAAKLFRHFVADGAAADMSPEARPLIEAMAELLRRHDYRLAPVLTALFRSEAFYAPRWRGAMVKSPAQLIAGTVRELRTPSRDPMTLARLMEEMGQRLFDPPSVAGWPGGRHWLSASSYFARQNACVYLITGQRDGQPPPIEESYDPAVLLEGLASRDPEAVVDHLLTALLAASPSSPAVRADRDRLVTFLRHRGTAREGVLELLLLITALPEYQLC